MSAPYARRSKLSQRLMPGGSHWTPVIIFVVALAVVGVLLWLR